MPTTSDDAAVFDDPTLSSPSPGEPAPSGEAADAAADVPVDRPTDTTTDTTTGQPVDAPAADDLAAAAVDLAREAAVEIAEPGTVGDHLGVGGEAPGVVTHAFACLAAGYRGWYWAVTVVAVPGAQTATVSDTVLLPGGEAVRAPAWVPWSDRLAPGDLRPHDVLPHRADDPHLEPGYTATDDGEADQIGLWELGLGRARVLGPRGRAAAAERWYLGDRGPTAEEAIHAAAPCSSCGYFLPMAGAMRQAFGVCANEWSPSDGRVVSVDHGCGAHSETDVEPPEPMPLPAPILDETVAEPIVLPPRETEPVAEQAEPVAEQAEPVAEQAEPVAEQAEPVAEQAEPVAEQAEPVAEQAEPVAEQAEPVAEQAEPVAEQAEPVAEQAEPVAEQAE